MKYLSVCSGIEAATVAWHPLGWQPVGFAEIEPFPAAVLAHHYPDVPNYGDMTKFQEWSIEQSVDLLVGGTPCQSFSVAGLRKGLADPRGNLALTYCAILDHFRPQWFVWENVPGVLSSGGGRDFGSFLGALAELGYGFAYRVLDAQYFGVAQRRRRVFVVGYLGDWRPAAEVLFERESLRGNPAPSRQARKDVAGSLTSRASGGGGGPGAGTDEACAGYLQPVIRGNCQDLAPTLDAQMDRKWGSHQWTNNGFAIIEPTIMSSGQANAEIRTDGGAPSLTCLHEAPIVTQPIGCDGAINGPVPPLMARSSRGGAQTLSPGHQTDGHMIAQPIALADTSSRDKNQNGAGWKADGTMYTLDTTGLQGVAQPIPFGVAEQPDVGHCLRSGASKADKHESTTYVAQPVAPTLTSTNDPSRSPQSTEITNQVAAVHAVSMAVRRLTPVECERLQGFPDRYTAIPWRGKQGNDCPDGPRYKALGNSMAVPVMAWIGRRIAMYNMQQRGMAA